MNTIKTTIILFFSLSTLLHANDYTCEVTSIEDLNTHKKSNPEKQISYKAKLEAGNLYITTGSGEITEYKTAMKLEGTTVMIDKDMSSTALLKGNLKSGLAIDYEEVKYIFACK